MYVYKPVNEKTGKTCCLEIRGTDETVAVAVAIVEHALSRYSVLAQY